MKKSLAIIMVMIMMLTSVLTANAATFESFFGGGTVTKAIETTNTIAVKAPGAVTFVEEDVTIYKTNAGSTETFAYKAMLETQPIIDHFNAYVATGKALCGSDAAALESFKNLPVTGQFTISIRYPKALAYNNSLGYFDADTLTLFDEVSRTQVEDGNFINATVITKVKDGVTEQSLEENVAAGNWLKDIYFTAESVSTSQLGTFTVTISMEGYTNIGTVGIINYSSAPASRTIIIKQSGGSKPSTPGGSGFIPTGPPVAVEPTKEPVTIIVPGVLNTDDHGAYIIGYPDGEVKPHNNITREEVTTIFYRLLKQEVRDIYYTKQNAFTDVLEERWSNEAISTMANAKYINGYGDGTCKPQNPITRAEFVQIAANLYGKDIVVDAKPYGDVSDHWGAKAIELASSLGWITGYEDGSFKPDQYITRAEAMTIVNRMTGRYVEEADVMAEVIKWPDNPTGTWYYTQVCEATNSHTFTRKANNYEIWKSLVVNNIVPDKQ